MSMPDYYQNPAKYYFKLMTNFTDFAIQDNGIKTFTQEALETAFDNKFYKNHRLLFKDPSSSRSKRIKDKKKWNHPPECNYEGGIVRHVLKTAFVARSLLQDHDLNIMKKKVLIYRFEEGEINQDTYDQGLKTLGNLAEKNKFFDFFERVDYDMIISASLLHDICKSCYDYENPEGIILGEWEEKTNYDHGLVGYEFLGNFMLREPEKETIRQIVRKHMGQFPESISELEKLKDTSILEEVCIHADRVAATKNLSFLPGKSLSESQFYTKPTLTGLKKAWKTMKF
jgi:hypothetical protein